MIQIMILQYGLVMHVNVRTMQGIQCHLASCCVNIRCCQVTAPTPRIVLALRGSFTPILTFPEVVIKWLQQDIQDPS